ncbi:ABC transporter transmembrane region 2 domain-containing protein [Ditylenchus destructor]|uniref:ABC transporter transmembrane region 2 domain-containing protein n=1 Tax=Ditylenchus destructor TaxID=166010 RepID=A0AAD4NH52_9BILA|nr:ABC transporter transmembrane region 2 domain-containing protein [Ditylenchus destructor]
MPSTFSKFAQLGQLRPTLRDIAPAVLGTSAVFVVTYLYKRHYKLGEHGPKGSKSNIKASEKGLSTGKEKAHVDWEFVKKLYRIVRILIPSIFSAEVLYMILIALSLLLRTYADLWMITTSTRIEASIIARKKQRFVKSIMHYLMCMPLISVVNSFLKFGISELKLRFRERLTHHFYKQYLK